MARKNAVGYINGTEALKLENYEYRRSQFVAYRGSKSIERNTVKPSRYSQENTLKARLVDIAERSELFCSLKFEDWRGVAFNRISKQDSIVFTIGAGVIAAISVALGA